MKTENTIKQKVKQSKDKVMTIRFTESDLRDYENRAIKEHISIAEFIRTAIKKGIAKSKVNRKP